MMARKQQHFEFFGPHGPALLIIALPLVCYALVYGCNASGCLQLWPSFQVPGFEPGTKLFTVDGLLIYTQWFLLVLGLHLLIPGIKAEGVVLPNKKRLTYKLNGGSSTKGA